MNRIKIKHLKFGKHKIKFRDGVNYIIGENASGKTTIFNMLQYALGIKKEFGYSLYRSDILELCISINNTDFLFQRHVEENRISINTNSVTHSWNLNSSDYSNFLYESLVPKFENDIETNIIKLLIKESFDSPLNAPKYASADDKLLILGINKRYENKIKKYINELSRDIKINKSALEKVNSYRNDVLLLFKSSVKNENSDITDILDQAYQKYDSDYKEEYDIFHKSQVLLEKLQYENEAKTDVIIRELDIFFNKLMSRSLLTPISLMEALSKKDRFWSEGENAIINIISKTVIQSKSDITNGVGLLVTDGSMSVFDNEAIYSWRKTIHETCEKDQLQYIEFTGNSRGVKNEDIIYELERGVFYE